MASHEPIDRLLERATEQHRAGNLGAARLLYSEVLNADPRRPLALFRSGLLELQEQQPQAALELIGRACAAQPDEPRFQFGLGQALQSLARWPEAANAYRRVLRIDPRSLDAHFALGLALQHDGQLAPAAAAYRDALALEPEHGASLGNLGAVLRELGELEQSIPLLRAAAALEPQVAAHAINLGMALCERREFAAAESTLTAALARDPRSADAAFNLGNALRGLGRSRAALESYQLALSLRPIYPDALNNLGNTYRELGELTHARAAYESALEARPDHVVALNNLGCVLRTLGQSDAAEDVLRRGLALAPHHAALHDNLGNVLKDAGALDEAIECYRQALACDPSSAATHSNLAYALSFQSLEPQPILEECLRWNARFAAPLAPRTNLSPGARDARRLKIGYVSADFREHCQSLFTLPLLSNHDRGSFEIFCYSSVEREDDHTRRAMACADTWRAVRTLDDAALCEVIRADRIDILMDLTMHMAGGRPQLFARKPAPVQIAWLAYPGTTGIAAMDYRLSDPRLDPDGFEAHYSERTIHLADSFWCYDPLATQPEVNGLPALERGHITLGCLNNPCKLTGATLALWGAVLRALPDSRLLLMAPAGRHRRSLLARLDAQQIVPRRVDFVEFRPRADYLRTYHEIDFALDTFPYNGHTTSLDALWMGVPTVTRVGRTSVGRGGLSQLHHLQLLELAADTDSRFLEAAVSLAGDLPRLAGLRQSLRARLERSPLMDGARFARSIEAAYRRAWSAQGLTSPAFPAERSSTF
jgi:predicted O-linked N-acetylglucosamine transferase (SPINDLY family)